MQDDSFFENKIQMQYEEDIEIRTKQNQMARRAIFIHISLEKGPFLRLAQYSRYPHKE